jgi:TonB family protein
MFGTLIESRRSRERHPAANLISSGLHVLLVAGVVYSTARDGVAAAAAEDHAVVITEYKHVVQRPVAAPAQVAAPRSTKLLAAPPRVSLPALKAPVIVPASLPSASSLDPVFTDDVVFTRRPVAGIPGVGSDSGTGDGIHAYTATQVERVARMGAGNREPDYPSILRHTGQTGRVRVSFVIDSTGRAMMESLRIIESSNVLFTEEVKKVLPKYTFVPAQIGMRKVPMLVELPFEFQLHKGRL